LIFRHCNAKIAPEEIEYLMARGLSGDEATAAIVRGFLDIEMKGLPENAGPGFDPLLWFGCAEGVKG